MRHYFLPNTQKSHVGDFLSVSQEFQRLMFISQLTEKIRKRSKHTQFPGLWKNSGAKTGHEEIVWCSSCRGANPITCQYGSNHVLSSFVFFHPSIIWPKKGQQPQILPQKATSEGAPYKHLCHMYLLQIKHYSCLNSAFPWVSTSWSGNLGQPHTRAFSQW